MAFPFVLRIDSPDLASSMPNGDGLVEVGPTDREIAGRQRCCQGFKLCRRVGMKAHAGAALR